MTFQVKCPWSWVLTTMHNFFLFLWDNQTMHHYLPKKNTMPHYLFEHICLPPPAHLILNHLPEAYFSSDLIFIHVYFILSVSLLFVTSLFLHNKYKFIMFNFSFYEYNLSHCDTHNNHVCTKNSYQSKWEMRNLCLLQPPYYLLSELAQQYKIPSWSWQGIRVQIWMYACMRGI